MNLYLDIDGVLLINENNAAPYADEFLRTVLAKYPDSTYWLTTHCWQGENRAVEVLTPHLKTETLEKLKYVKPSTWGEYKTDGIDFSQPFLWFDDDLYEEERADLVQNNALKSWVEVDLVKDPNQLHKLISLLEILYLYNRTLIQAAEVPDGWMSKAQLVLRTCPFRDACHCS